jgi:ketosteroid isomerase-like protein
MRSVLVIGIVILSASLALGQGAAGASRTDESKILALENGWNQAQVHHDAKALESLVADSFVSTDNDGTVFNKAQFLADTKDMSYKADMVANDNVKVQLFPNAAVVTGTYHAKGTSKGKPFDHWGRFTDTWIYFGGRWQCVASHTSHIAR